MEIVGYMRVGNASQLNGADSRERYAIYMRADQDEKSGGLDLIVKQRKVLMDYAKDKGLDLTEEYFDMGAPAHDMNRPGLQALIADHAAGEFDKVLVVDMGRLTRTRAEFPFVVETVDEINTKIKEIRQRTGMSQAKFCEALNIPIRTLQKWEIGERSCPEYVVELIAYRTGHDPEFKKGE